MNERSEIPTVGEQEDIISSLPDEVIFEILDHLQSLGEASKFCTQSNRWFRLWQSYLAPIFQESRSTKGLINDDQDKIFQLQKGSNYTGSDETVRIEIGWCQHRGLARIFLNYVFRDLAANTTMSSSSIIPREIDIACETEQHRIPRGVLLSSQFRGLRILKLRNFDFSAYANVFTHEEDNPFANLGSSLRELCLDRVSFPNERILNDIIKAASLLYTLIISWINDEIKTLEIRNHPNLKTLEVVNIPSLTDFDITGANGLETLQLQVLNECDTIRIPSRWNLKVLHIDGVVKLTENDLNNLISKTSSLECLTLINPGQVRRLWIFGNPKLQGLTLHYEFQRSTPPMVIEMEAPMLTDFKYMGDIDSFPELTLLQGRSKKSEAGRLTTFYCYITGGKNVDKLNQRIIDKYNPKEVKVVERP